MIILIDGYNVLRQLIPKEISESERMRFIAQLAQYNKQKRHQITVVFDGGGGKRPEKFKKSDIEVVYSGHQQNADDYIKDYVYNHAQRELLVVSADRQLCRRVLNAGATTIEPYAFLFAMAKSQEESAQKPGKSGHAIKTAAENEALLDELMQEAAEFDIIKPESAVAARSKRPAAKLSKHERKLLQKVKKL